MRSCRKCLVEKGEEEFSKNKRLRDGVMTICKVCNNAERRTYMATYRTVNREKLKGYQDKHRNSDIEETRKKIRVRYAKNALKDPALYIWKGAKKRATLKKLPFNLEVSDIEIPAVCPVLGLPIYFGFGENGEVLRRSENSPSIDRLIPEAGYVKGNVVIISWRANRLKGDGTAEEMRSIANYIEKNQ